jgi:hypothetical protein
MQKLAITNILILFFVLGINTNTLAKVDSLPIPEIKAREFITKKWIITDVEVRKQKLKSTDLFPYLFVEFIDDGLLVFMSDGEKIFGKWKYKHKNAQITCNVNHEEEIMQIFSLNNDEMVVELTLDQDKLKLFFKAI